MQKGYPRIFEIDSNINDEIKSQVSAMKTQDFIDSLSVKDILEKKPIYKQTQIDINPTNVPYSGLRTKHERQRLINYMSEKIATILKSDCDETSLYQKLIEALVDSRLRIKIFDPNAVVLQEGEKMDSMLIVLEGNVDVRNSKTGEIVCSYKPNEIVALFSMDTHLLNIHEDIQVNPKSLNHYFGQPVKLTSQDRPFQ